MPGGIKYPALPSPTRGHFVSDFFEQRIAQSPPLDPVSREREVQFAAAALLMVCAKSDFLDHPEEDKAIVDALRSVFSLDEAAVEELLANVTEATAVRQLQEFTSLVNRFYLPENKRELIENLWRVAYADGRLDRYEELFIGRVAFLISVPTDVVQACRTEQRPS